MADFDLDNVQDSPFSMFAEFLNPDSENLSGFNLDFKELKKELIKPEIEIDETTFRFDKFNGKEGFEVVELIHSQLGFFVTADLNIKDLKDLIYKVVFACPREFTEMLKERLYTVTFFKNNNTRIVSKSGADEGQRYTKLLNNEERAFDDALLQYEIILRSLCVNFLSSGARLASRWMRILRPLVKNTQ